MILDHVHSFRPAKEQFLEECMYADCTAGRVAQRWLVQMDAQTRQLQISETLDYLARGLRKISPPWKPGQIKVADGVFVAIRA